jgi:hypothetical protein
MTREACRLADAAVLEAFFTRPAIRRDTFSARDAMFTLLKSDTPCGAGTPAVVEPTREKIFAYTVPLWRHQPSLSCDFGHTSEK